MDHQVALLVQAEAVAVDQVDQQVLQSQVVRGVQVALEEVEGEVELQVFHVNPAEQEVQVVFALFMVARVNHTQPIQHLKNLI
jgi:hypothetical protein